MDSYMYATNPAHVDVNAKAAIPDQRARAKMAGASWDGTIGWRPTIWPDPPGTLFIHHRDKVKQSQYHTTLTITITGDGWETRILYSNQNEQVITSTSNY